MYSPNSMLSVPAPRSRSGRLPGAGAGGVVSGTTAIAADASPLRLRARSETAPAARRSSIAAPADAALSANAFWAGVRPIDTGPLPVAAAASAETSAPASATAGDRRPGGSGGRAASPASASAKRATSTLSTGSENHTRSAPSLRSRAGARSPDSPGRTASLVAASATPVSPANGLPSRSASAPSPMSTRTGGLDAWAAAAAAAWPPVRVRVTSTPRTSTSAPPSGVASAAPEAEPLSPIRDGMTDVASTCSSNVSVTVPAARLSRCRPPSASAGGALSGLTASVTLASSDGLLDRSQKASARASRREAFAIVAAAFWAGVSSTTTDCEPWAAGAPAGASPETAAPARPTATEPPVPASRSSAGLVALALTCSPKRTSSAPAPMSRTGAASAGSGAVVSRVTSTASPASSAMPLRAASLTAPPPMSRRMRPAEAPASPPCAARYAAVTAALWAAVRFTATAEPGGVPAGGAVSGPAAAPSRPARPPCRAPCGLVEKAVRFTRDRSIPAASTASENCMRSVPSFRSSAGAPKSAGGVASVVTSIATFDLPANPLPARSRKAPAAISSRAGGAVALAAVMLPMWTRSRSSVIEVPFGPRARAPSRLPTSASSPPSTSMRRALTEPASTCSSNTKVSVFASRLSRGLRPSARRGGAPSAATFRGTPETASEGLPARSWKAPRPASIIAVPPERSRATAQAFWSCDSLTDAPGDAHSGTGG